jgi:hypothetical protein
MSKRLCNMSEDFLERVFMYIKFAWFIMSCMFCILYNFFVAG